MRRQSINRAGLLLFIIVVIIIGQSLGIARAQSHAAGVVLKTAGTTCAARAGLPDAFA